MSSVTPREYREFVVDMDRGDPESLHIIGVREGMSQKPIDPEAVPKFEDTLNIGKDFNTACDRVAVVDAICHGFAGGCVSRVRAR